MLKIIGNSMIFCIILSGCGASVPDESDIRSVLEEKYTQNCDIVHIDKVKKTNGYEEKDSNGNSFYILDYEFSAHVDIGKDAKKENENALSVIRKIASHLSDEKSRKDARKAYDAQIDESEAFFDNKYKEFYRKYSDMQYENKQRDWDLIVSKNKNIVEQTGSIREKMDENWRRMVDQMSDLERDLNLIVSETENIIKQADSIREKMDKDWRKLVEELSGINSDLITFYDYNNGDFWRRPQASIKQDKLHELQRILHTDSPKEDERTKIYSLIFELVTFKFATIRINNPAFMAFKYSVNDGQSHMNCRANNVYKDLTHDMKPFSISIDAKASSGGIDENKFEQLSQYVNMLDENPSGSFTGKMQMRKTEQGWKNF